AARKLHDRADPLGDHRRHDGGSGRGPVDRLEAPPLTAMDDRELRRVFTLGNAFKEGDLPVGGTADDAVREDARRALLGATIGDIRRAVFVDDGVTAALGRSRDRRFDDDLDPLTIARVKATLLSPAAASWAARHCHALSSEVIAAV